MEKQKCPEIRFKGFHQYWEKNVLGEITTFINGRAYSQDELLTKGKYPVLRVGNFNTNSNWYYSDLELAKKYYAEKGDLLYTWSTIFSPQIWKGEKVIYHYHIWKVDLSEKLNKLFTFHYLKADEIALTSNTNGSTMIHVTKGEMESKELYIPCLDEQEKIGTFFEDLNEKISSIEQKLAQTQHLKKAMLEKMFPKEGSNCPEIRLKGFSGDWEERQLKDISFKVLEKNSEHLYSETFTNSAQFGVISQRDFFDKDISNTSNIGGYYVVKDNDFIYNPRISNFAPVGPVKRNKLGRTGVVSPLYFVFRTHDADHQFLETYFETSVWHKFMLLNGDTGARSDRLAIKDTIFMEMPVYCPSFEEQQKIGQFFKQLDETIKLQQQQLQTVKNLKQALLEKMFV